MDLLYATSGYVVAVLEFRGPHWTWLIEECNSGVDHAVMMESFRMWFRDAMPNII